VLEARVLEGAAWQAFQPLPCHESQAKACHTVLLLLPSPVHFSCAVCALHATPCCAPCLVSIPSLSLQHIVCLHWVMHGKDGRQACECQWMTGLSGYILPSILPSYTSRMSRQPHAFASEAPVWLMCGEAGCRLWPVHLRWTSGWAAWRRYPLGFLKDWSLNPQPKALSTWFPRRARLFLSLSGSACKWFPQALVALPPRASLLQPSHQCVCLRVRACIRTCLRGLRWYGIERCESGRKRARWRSKSRACRSWLCMGIRTGWFLSNWYGTHTFARTGMVHTHFLRWSGTHVLHWYLTQTPVHVSNASTRVKRQYTNTVAVQLGHDIHSVVVEQAR